MRHQLWTTAKSLNLVGTGRNVFLRIFAWFLRLLHFVFDLMALPELLSFLWCLTHPSNRKMTALEIQEAKLVYGEQIPYDLVRITPYSLIAKAGAYFARASQMGICAFYTIHFTRPIDPKPGNKDMAWLVHELAHVHQMVNAGSRYTSEAIFAQFSDGYGYGEPESLHLYSIKRLNREQQASIPEDYYYYILYRKRHPHYGYLQASDYVGMISEYRAGII